MSSTRPPPKPSKANPLGVRDAKESKYLSLMGTDPLVSDLPQIDRRTTRALRVFGVRSVDEFIANSGNEEGIKTLLLAFAASGNSKAASFYFPEKKALFTEMKKEVSRLPAFTSEEMEALLSRTIGTGWTATRSKSQFEKIAMELSEFVEDDR